MRSLTLPLAAAAAALAASAAAQHPSPQRSGPLGLAAPARCDAGKVATDYRGKGAGPRKLGEMPPANQIYAVYNRVDGCPQPIVVRTGVGANPHRQVSPTRSPRRATRAD